MEWKRTEDHYREYSTLTIGLRHYISMVRTKGNNTFQYIYSKNGVQVLAGGIIANNWDEAERVVVERILSRLHEEAEYWNMVLNDFEKAVNVNESLD